MRQKRITVKEHAATLGSMVNIDQSARTIAEKIKAKLMK